LRIELEHYEKSKDRRVSDVGEFHPYVLTEPDVNLSIHPALIGQPSVSNGFALLVGSSSDPRSWPIRKADRSNPFAPSPLRDFFTTTGWSAPVLRIGTLTLVGPPLEFLPCHRSDRFPGSMQKPGSGSRHLYTGGHLGSKQGFPLILNPIKKLSFDLTFIFSMPHQWFAVARLPGPYLP